MAKKFKTEEKMQILKEASENGVKITLEKYALYPATFYYWKKKLELDEERGLDHGFTLNKEERLKKLEKENQALKELLAEKELEAKLKNEVLKKKFPHLRNVL